MPGRPKQLISFDHLALNPEETALFLDFDGTLADIAEHPEAVALHPDTKGLLSRLEKSTGGAVAIVTGRQIETIDHFLSPLRLPVAGVHGMERRDAKGDIVSVAVEGAQLEMLHGRLEALVDRISGTVLEVKPGSLAFHYRRRPELAEECVAAVHEAVDGLDGLQILHGKMVVEIKSGKATKADAVAAFMLEEPFRDRIPLFAGDDVTDEDAFREVARLEGVSIKIGKGATRASFRAESTDAFRDWLARLAEGFETRQMAG